MRQELKKVQRSSATTPLLEKKSLPESPPCGERGLRGDYARRRSASTDPYVSHLEPAEGQNYSPKRTRREWRNIFVSSVFEYFVPPEYRGILLPRGAWSSTPLEDLEQRSIVLRPRHSVLACRSRPSHGSARQQGPRFR